MSEIEYWNQRYSSGGDSGAGSSGDHARWKWAIIDSLIPDLNDVIDVGCGDLRFWSGRNCKRYVGIDFSEDVIRKNRIQRPDWTFVHANAASRIEGLTADVVFCFDLLYHVMGEENFMKILANLNLYSDRWIFVVTLVNNPFHPNVTDNYYQYFRNLFQYSDGFFGFGLKKFSRDPHSHAGMFVWKRTVECTP